MRKTLILNKSRVEKLIDMPGALPIVEEALRAHGQGRVQMPAKIYIHLDKYDGDFRAMPAYIAGLEACGVKWVNVHPRNSRYGLPTVMALIILSDPKTGFPLAVMDGTHITNIRTGASGGIAAKYLANKDSSSVALVGCGVQAGYQLIALNELFNIRLVTLYDHHPANAAAFIKKMKRLGLKMKIFRNINSCVAEADIVCTTTPSRKPIVKSEWIGRGAHINAIGADAKGKEELEPALLKKAKIVTDDIKQAVHSGEINVPISKKIIGVNDIYATLGEVITGRKRGRESCDEITIFDSTGLAIQDIAVAYYVYKKAVKDIITK